MIRPLIRKLEQFTKLSDENRRMLENAPREVKVIDPRQDIIKEDDKPDYVHLILDGWAARYKVLPNGNRSIMAYLIPGDLCDVHVTLLNQMDHSISTLSTCRIAFIPRETMYEIMCGDGQLSRAIWWSILVDQAILREWLVTVGQRSAAKRVAHLICEMLLRSKAVGLTEDSSFDLPLTQEELADTMGISAVHMNRTLQELRSQGLITNKGKRMIVNDAERLFAFADFNPNYLHQMGARA